MNVWLIVLAACVVLFGVIAFFLVKELKRPQYSGTEQAQAQAAADDRNVPPEESFAAAPESTAPAPPPLPDELPTFVFPETIPAFQEKRCCICDHELGWRHAVLFCVDTGAEARIDYDCARRLNTIVKGADYREIAVAARSMMARLDDVDPMVAAYLRRYIKLAAQRLRERADEQ